MFDSIETGTRLEPSKMTDLIHYIPADKFTNMKEIKESVSRQSGNKSKKASSHDPILSLEKNVKHSYSVVNVTDKKSTAMKIKKPLNISSMIDGNVSGSRIEISDDINGTVDEVVNDKKFSPVRENKVNKEKISKKPVAEIVSTRKNIKMNDASLKATEVINSKKLENIFNPTKYEAKSLKRSNSFDFYDTNSEKDEDTNHVHVRKLYNNQASLMNESSKNAVSRIPSPSAISISKKPGLTQIDDKNGKKRRLVRNKRSFSSEDNSDILSESKESDVDVLEREDDDEKFIRSEMLKKNGKENRRAQNHTSSMVGYYNNFLYYVICVSPSSI